MELELTLDELYLLVEQARKKEYREQKFLAALKGIDLDEETKDSTFEEIQRRADAELAGKTEEEFVFDLIGIEFTKE